MYKDNSPYLKLPILGQLLTLFPKIIFDKCVAGCNSDSAHRTVSTWSHFVFMTYGILTGSGTLREIYRNFEMMGEEIIHLGLAKIPARSTYPMPIKIEILMFLGSYIPRFIVILSPFWSYSFLNGLINDEIKPSDVYIFDSTTVSLFKDIFKIQVDRR